ncbi:hypothetical protein BDR06DRAFT_968581 [Suillus hirtellus]|nr:hypothetical protein BDR06DRAFT_968581 [Suillus hirtellus]
MISMLSNVLTPSELCLVKFHQKVIDGRIRDIGVSLKLEVVCGPMFGVSPSLSTSLKGCNIKECTEPIFITLCDIQAKDPQQLLSKDESLHSRKKMQTSESMGSLGTKDLVAEFNRHIVLGAVNESDADKMDSDDPELYRSFKKLMEWCPLAHNLLWLSAKHEILAFAYNKLNEGSDRARGDNSASLKCAVTNWLMECTPTPNPTIHRQDKSGWGFYNDVTGRLLCPVDYDWSNPIVRASIQDYHPDFCITTCSWLSFLYENGCYDPQNPANGLFKGKLLIKLRFALSSTGSWHIIDDKFNHQEFYDNIVDYLKLHPSPEATKDVNDLLLWWNQKFFGRKFVSDYCPQHANKMLVAMTLARR